MDSSAFEMIMILRQNNDLYNTFILDEVINIFKEEDLSEIVRVIMADNRKNAQLKWNVIKLKIFFVID